MLDLNLVFNFSASISFMYFLAYVITFITFFFITNCFSKYSTNLNQIVNLLKYNQTQFFFFVTTLLIFLGIPPFFLFSAKFAGLVLSWTFSGFIFFLITLFIVFLSFALYLQLFDLLFKSNTCLTDNYSLSSEITKLEKLLELNSNKYSQHSILVNTTIFSIFGFFVFKDLCLCLVLFI